MIVPSIDIMGGKVVQLKQGKDLVLTAERDAVDLACEFNRYGEVAVIDLDAAMGKGSNLKLIEQVCRVADVRVGGGIRDLETARTLLKAGAKRLIFGTAASEELCGQLPQDIVMVALDHKDGKVLDKGWQNATDETVVDRAKRLAPYCGSFLSTFVQTEGTMAGISIDAARDLQKQLQKPLTVAGGTATTLEVSALAREGIDVQVGMGLYTGKIDPVQSVVDSVEWPENKLVPTVVQNETGQVLMVAYSSPQSLEQALKQGKGVFFSRSRNEIWVKGLTSGSTQELISCRVDCDRDCLLFTVRQTKGACHSGSYSCFDQISTTPRFSVAELFETLKERKRDMPEKSYTATLLSNRKKLMKKIVEETYEVTSFDSRENLRWEIADLIYHLSILAVAEGIDWSDIESELASRRR